MSGVHAEGSSMLHTQKSFVAAGASRIGAKYIPDRTLKQPNRVPTIVSARSALTVCMCHSIAFFIPTFDKDTPLALRKLQINMARKTDSVTDQTSYSTFTLVPGSTHHQQQLNSSVTDLHMESPNDSPAPAKRPNDVSPGVPAKKLKEDTPKKTSTCRLETW